MAMLMKRGLAGLAFGRIVGATVYEAELQSWYVHFFGIRSPKLWWRPKLPFESHRGVRLKIQQSPNFGDPYGIILRFAADLQ